jgi:hypothetical protein
MYLVLDTFAAPMNPPALCTNEDEDGMFGTYEEADAFGVENCQEYQVIKKVEL